jgi:hypothetical protein
MEYMDFELCLRKENEQGYTVTVEHSPIDRPRVTTQVPLDDLTFRNQLGHIERVRGEVARLCRSSDMKRNMKLIQSLCFEEVAFIKSIGKTLFNVLLPSEVLTCYRRSMDAARSQGKRLRLRLRIEAPELAVLPWEFLFDEGEGDHISLNQGTPLTRYLNRPLKSLTINPPIRILGMVACPRNLPVLVVEDEQKKIAAAIGHLVEAGMVEIEWVKGQSWQSLDGFLRDSKKDWHIFHFIGHGKFDPQKGEGWIAMVNDTDGNSQPMSGEDLGRLFARYPSIRLAVLNTCEGARASETKIFTSTGAVLVLRGIPAVVSMQYEITDRAASEFSLNFYDALARKMPVDAAITEARFHLKMTPEISTEWGTPVLYMCSPDGNLFNLREQSSIFPQEIAVQPPATPLSSTPRATGETRRGLEILRRKVHDFWIEGVLEHSLYHNLLIDLGMTRETAAVDSPWISMREKPRVASVPIQADRTIADVFDEEGSSLLIIGEPGCGKTTTMLNLAKALIERSERDPGYPLPVIFNLSSWTAPLHGIVHWLVQELSAKYQIPKEIGRAWVQDRRLLPLLDGLDELFCERRAECVEAINAFIKDPGSMGLVVCSRLREYTDLPVRLTLNAAVRLQQLTDQQVQGYLARGGSRLASLQEALRRDSALRIDARSVLMLNLMVRSYQGLTLDEGTREQIEPTALRRKRLMDAYVDRMFSRAQERKAA